MADTLKEIARNESGILVKRNCHRVEKGLKVGSFDFFRWDNLSLFLKVDVESLKRMGLRSACAVNHCGEKLSLGRILASGRSNWTVSSMGWSVEIPKTGMPIANALPYCETVVKGMVTL